MVRCMSGTFALDAARERLRRKLFERAGLQLYMCREEVDSAVIG